MTSVASTRHRMTVLPTARFINFNLPQFYQIVKVDGREQVIPFRTKSIGNMPPANQDHDTPLLQQYFS